MRGVTIEESESMFFEKELNLDDETPDEEFNYKNGSNDVRSFWQGF